MIAINKIQNNMNSSGYKSENLRKNSREGGSATAITKRIKCMFPKTI